MTEVKIAKPEYVDPRLSQILEFEASFFHLDLADIWNIDINRTLLTFCDEAIVIHLEAGISETWASEQKNKDNSLHIGSDYAMSKSHNNHTITYIYSICQIYFTFLFSWFEFPWHTILVLYPFRCAYIPHQAPWILYPVPFGPDPTCTSLGHLRPDSLDHSCEPQKVCHLPWSLSSIAEGFSDCDISYLYNKKQIYEASDEQSDLESQDSSTLPGIWILSEFPLVHFVHLKIKSLWGYWISNQVYDQDGSEKHWEQFFACDNRYQKTEDIEDWE